MLYSYQTRSCFVSIRMSSLTLNICKEAKLFYQNEQKIRENQQDIHPSSTIHMKSYFPDQSINYSRSMNNHEKYDRENYHRTGNGLIPNKKTRFMDDYEKKSNGNINSLKMMRDNRKLKEKLKDDQKITSRYRNNHIGKKINDIPIRDVHGGHNSDEELEEERKEEKTTSEIIDPEYEDVWQYGDDDCYDIEIDGDESRNISENNPFAKQRVLKSKYKNMYPD